jgi:hypothetical protein
LSRVPWIFPIALLSFQRPIHFFLYFFASFTLPLLSGL